MSWINKETEKINTTSIFNWFKLKNKLNEGNQIWESVKVPTLFNKNVAISFFIEKGFMDFTIYDQNNNLFFHGSFDNPIGLDDFNFVEYYRKINENVDDEIGDLEITKYLNFYLRFIDEYLSEIFLGNFSKLNHRMIQMKSEQIKSLQEMI